MISKNWDDLALKTLKMNGVAAINKANSGHPGMVISSAKIVHTIFSRHLNYHSLKPNWINRDRFILSPGHGAPLLYAQLRMLRLLTEEDLKKLRQKGSLTPGHPEYGHTLGVEATTGPLGQGLAMAVGLAMAREHLHSKFKEVDHLVYVLVSDGELQEGISHEALALAGKNNLSSLIILHDSNDVQLDSPVAKTSSDDLAKRMASYGIYYQKVANEIAEIDKAIEMAKNSEQPSFIEVKTIIGEGTPKAGTSAVHGAPLGEDIKFLEKSLDWKEESYFSMPTELENNYIPYLLKKGVQAYKNFKVSKQLEKYLQSDLNKEYHFEFQDNLATRAYTGQILSKIAEEIPQIIGGAADLSVSTKTVGAEGNFEEGYYGGRNILFGVRELAMASIANGLALHSVLRPFVATFLVFSDYVKPALRLSALMNLPVTYIFSHDSVFVGEDGPTHQPIEQLAMLRATPNLAVFRPADQNELLGAFTYAKESHSPVAIATTRQNIQSLGITEAQKVSKGAYLAFKGKRQWNKGDRKWNLLASGSELALAYQVAKDLDLNLYSVPAMNLIKNHSWNTANSISIEAASTFGWAKYAAYNFGIDSFGISAPGIDVYEHFGFNAEILKAKIAKIISKKER